MTTISVVDTTSDNVLKGGGFRCKTSIAALGQHYWQAARSAHAVLFSEDLQDHIAIQGMTVLNPFDPANEVELYDLSFSR